MTRRVALITGASAGIGADLARVFARRGHDVALLARRRDRLETLADEIAAQNRPRPLVIACDLAAPGAVEAVLAALRDGGAEVDILVNNAGYGLLGGMTDLAPAQQIGIIDVNVRALVGLTFALLPQIMAGPGRILNVASVVAFFPGPGMAVYYASKAFVQSFSLALGEELRGRGVVVTALCPGLTATEFQARAGMADQPAISRLRGATSRSVADAGYAGLMAARRVVVPGFFNKVVTLMMPLLPNAIVLPLILLMQKRRPTSLKAS